MMTRPHGSVLIVGILLLLATFSCCSSQWNLYHHHHHHYRRRRHHHHHQVAFPRKTKAIWGHDIRGGSIQPQQQNENGGTRRTDSNNNKNNNNSSSSSKQSNNDRNGNLETLAALPSTTATVNSPYFVVSTIAVGDAFVKNGDSTLQPGCHLFDASSSSFITITTANNQESRIIEPFWHGRAQWEENKNNNSLALWHSLALVSDIVIVRLRLEDGRYIKKDDDDAKDNGGDDGGNPILSNELIRAFIAGLRQRTRMGNLSKGRLLVLVEHEDQVPAVTEYLSDRLEEFHDIDIILKWDVCCAQQSYYNAALSELLSSLILANEEGTASILDDPTAFSYLLQQVYRSVGGMIETSLLQESNGPILSRHTMKEETKTEELIGFAKDKPVEKDKKTHSNMSAPEVESQQHVSSSGTRQHIPIDEKDSSSRSSSSSTDDETQQLMMLPDDSKNILATALCALDSVQTQQEQRWSDPESLPIAFAKQVNPILQRLVADLKPLPVQTRSVIEQQVAARLQQLHQQYLNDLRDYFGVMYESLLEDDSRSSSSSSNDIAVLQSAAAQRVATAFKKAAQESTHIPALVTRRKGKTFHLTMNLDYMPAYEGLLSDMKQATELRQPDNFLLEEDTNEGVGNNTTVASKKQKQLPKWVKKLAARAVVLGVNYLQGWLAWQSIRRAALERERNLPKFPLF